VLQVTGRGIESSWSGVDSESTTVEVGVDLGRRVEAGGKVEAGLGGRVDSEGESTRRQG
jgi:hypothetical protein